MCRPLRPPQKNCYTKSVALLPISRITIRLIRAPAPNPADAHDARFWWELVIHPWLTGCTDSESLCVRTFTALRTLRTDGQLTTLPAYGAHDGLQFTTWVYTLLHTHDLHHTPGSRSLHELSCSCKARTGNHGFTGILFWESFPKQNFQLEIFIWWNFG